MAAKSDNKMRLRIVTPLKMAFDDDIHMVILRTEEGDMGILPGYEATTAILSYGTLKILNDDDEILFSVLGGFVEISSMGVTVMTDAAEHPNEIDKERAQRARERAERLLQERSKDVDRQRAELALRRALVRIEVSSYTITKGK